MTLGEGHPPHPLPVAQGDLEIYLIDLFFCPGDSASSTPLVGDDTLVRLRELVGLLRRREAAEGLVEQEAK